MGARVAAGDRQAQAGAATVGRATMIKSHQPLEDPLPIGRRDAGTRVEDVDHRPGRLSLQRHVHLALGTGCAYGVVDHVAQDPADLVRVAHHRRVGATHRDGRLGMQHAHPIQLRSGQRAERDRLQGQVDAGIQPRGGEQIGDQGAGPLGFADQQRLQMLALIMIELIIMMQQRLRGRLYAGDRRPQLVRGVGQKRPRALLGLPGPELRSLELVQHLVEGLGRLSQFGVGAGRRQPRTPPATGDFLGQLGHRVQRSQRQSHGQRDQQCAQHQGGHRGDDQHAPQRRPRRRHQ